MAKKNENLKLKKEDLKKKYGGAFVMGVPAELVNPILKKTYTPKEEAFICSSNETQSIQTPLILSINRQMESHLRCDAELDSSFKQVIPYTVLVYNRKIFCTHRLNGGDARLAGSYSVGTGGHVDDGERVYDTMVRELKEEVGLVNRDIMHYDLKGFILDNSSEVNSVHLGAVFVMYISRGDITCLEHDKLSGEWVDYAQLKELYESDALESWSKIVFEHVLTGGVIYGG